MSDDPKLFERMAIVETHYQTLKGEVGDINKKLDELLSLKAKGAGAFWLASSLFGVGLTVGISFVTDWFKGF